MNVWAKENDKSLEAFCKTLRSSCKACCPKTSIVLAQRLITSAVYPNPIASSLLESATLDLIESKKADRAYSTVIIL